MQIKQELLLGIIQEYIKTKEPIGSHTLKNRQNFCVSSATIRNYFKVLEREGALFQPHTSSGRVPTHTSLYNYWKKELNYLLEKTLRMDAGLLDSKSKCYGIFCVALPRESNILLEILECEAKSKYGSKYKEESKEEYKKRKESDVYQSKESLKAESKKMFKTGVKERYLILRFTRGQVAISLNERLNERLLHFLEPFINMDIIDIIKVANEVGARDLAHKLLALEQVDLTQNSLRSGIENLGGLLDSKGFDANNFWDIFSGRILLKQGRGIYADKFISSGYLGIIHDVDRVDSMCQSTNLRMLSLGMLTRDFKSFYTELAS